MIEAKRQTSPRQEAYGLLMPTSGRRTALPLSHKQRLLTSPADIGERCRERRDKSRQEICDLWSGSTPTPGRTRQVAPYSTPPVIISQRPATADAVCAGTRESYNRKARATEPLARVPHDPVIGTTAGAPEQRLRRVYWTFRYLNVADIESMHALSHDTWPYVCMHEQPVLCASVCCRH
jgi:hypothetical protein